MHRFTSSILILIGFIIKITVKEKNWVYELVSILTTLFPEFLILLVKTGTKYKSTLIMLGQYTVTKHGKTSPFIHLNVRRQTNNGVSPNRANLQIELILETPTTVYLQTQ